MMPSSGPPTPNGVGGPTPPLVSRGSVEEWKTKIPTWGPPTSNGGGGPTPPPTGERGGGEPDGPLKRIDTTVPHELGTTHVRSKQEPPPQKGQTVH